MKSSKQIYAFFGLVALILLAWIVFFYFIPPEMLIRKIGIQNSYLIAFVMALIAGFSSVTGTSFYATLAALAHGGGNAIILGVVSGLGLFLSDSLFYFVASYGRDVIARVASNWEKVFDRIQRWVQRAPTPFVYLAVLLYSAFAPIPNDLMLAILAVSRYSYKEFAPYLLLGDITMTLLITHFAGGAT